MSKSLGHKVVNGAIALTLVFGLAACGESAADLQRKTELVEQLSERAVATCVLQEEAPAGKPYIERLTDVLTETRATTLDYLIENDITVCLDQRLQGQQSTFWGDEAEGIYYPDVKVISLWDNGQDQETAGFWDWTAVSHGPDFLNNFDDTFGGWGDKYESLADVASPLFAHHYTTRVGKTTNTHYSWHDADQRSMGVVFENQPFLRVPPIVTGP